MGLWNSANVILDNDDDDGALCDDSFGKRLIMLILSQKPSDRITGLKARTDFEMHFYKSVSSYPTAPKRFQRDFLA